MNEQEQPLSRFGIPRPIFDEEAITASKLRQYAYTAPFMMDNWPAVLWDLTFGPNIFLPFPVHEFTHVADGKTTERVTRFFAELDIIMAGKPWFVRLNTRSPKDASYPDAPIARDAAQSFDLLASSMRIFDDSCDLTGIHKPVFLVLRKPVDIPAKYEFRCFVKDRQLIGISQYFYGDVFDGLADEAQHIHSCIEKYHREKVSPAFPEENYIFDVFFSSESCQEPTLIEVNPYGISDPCLFSSYANLEARGGILVRSHEMEAQP